MIGAGEFRAGVRVEIDGEPYLIIDAVHVKPAKGGAFVRTKFRNLRTGNQLERTYRVVEKFDEPEIEERRLQYLYEQAGECHFMDSQNYEQLSLTADQLGESKKFL
ncbi:MAG TPA: elongation factor P, partial [Nitrospiria bacterium]|nr:elongation factor P [Nitrospiria bacterium]